MEAVLAEAAPVLAVMGLEMGSETVSAGMVSGLADLPQSRCLLLPAVLAQVLEALVLGVPVREAQGASAMARIVPGWEAQV
jgi:hypothetical protein